MNYGILEKLHVNAEINEWRIRANLFLTFSPLHRRHYFGLLVPAKPSRGLKTMIIAYNS